MSSLCRPYPSSVISMSMPTSFFYWGSSTTNVWLPGVVSCDGIFSTMMTSGSYCLLPYDCVCALVLTMDFMVVWFGSSCLGGSMV
jgi:hypothetical protein